MTSDELFNKAKNAIGINHNYLDETLKPYFNSALFYLSNAGVADEIIFSEASVCAVARYISDTWNYGGNTTLSPFFKEMVVMLSLYSGSIKGGCEHE
jgi:hypothetical protein